MKRKFTLCALLLLTMVFSGVAADPEVSPYHPWRGLKVAYLGDSITDSAYLPKVEKYWKWLSKWLGITPYVYAKAGREWTDLERQANLLKDEHGDDFDAISVFVGTNDFMYATPMGEWYAETAEEVDFGLRAEKRPIVLKKRVLSMDPTTYKGRINQALAMLKSRYPDKQIVILTPIHRGGFYSSEKNWQPDENYANRLGLYLSDYVDAVKEASAIWSVPVIDLYSLSGLYPLDDAYAPGFTNAEKDRLHPNSDGHYRIALTLLYQLSALPGKISK